MVGLCACLTELRAALKVEAHRAGLGGKLSALCFALAVELQDSRGMRVAPDPFKCRGNYAALECQGAGVTPGLAIIPTPVSFALAGFFHLEVLMNADDYRSVGRNPDGSLNWRTRLLHEAGKLIGIQFHVCGWPYGAYSGKEWNVFDPEPRTARLQKCGAKTEAI